MGLCNGEKSCIGRAHSWLLFSVQENREYRKKIIKFSFHKPVNLVHLLWFCDGRDKRIFVYGYTYKRSLDFHLNSNDLTRCQRFALGWLVG